MKLISVTLDIDGEKHTFENLSQASVNVPILGLVEYGDNGYTDQDEYGCVQCQEIDEFLFDLDGGNEYEQIVANTAPNKFALFLPDSSYEPDIRKAIIRNYHQDNSRTFTSAYIGAMAALPFYPDVRRDETDTTPPFSVIYGDALEGYCTPVYGFTLFDVHKKFIELYKQVLRQAVKAARTAHIGNPFDDFYKSK